MIFLLHLFFHAVWLISLLLVACCVAFIAVAVAIAHIQSKADRSFREARRNAREENDNGK